MNRRAHERKPLHIKLNEKEWTTIEIENLTRNVSQAHLQHIFGLYAKAPVKTERHYNDYARALIFFESKEDAKVAYDHLAGSSK